MAYVAHNKVRMHDTDMAGRLYFPRQFRFVHDALEDLMESQGFPFQSVFNENHFVFVIVHAEADYYTLLQVGDNLEVHISCERIGNSSFTLLYQIYKEDKTLAGLSRTVHVALDRTTQQKIPLPAPLLALLNKFKVL